MKIKTIKPELTYPYLAVWTGRDNHIEVDLDNIKTDELLLVSKVGQQIYVQRLLGGHDGFYTKNEFEYTPLPAGFEVTITQS